MSPAPTNNPEFLERYRAISARDQRFDGQFITAVRSTGIYCRPSCPARTPKPENVTFYRTAAAAHTAGYRACRRCLPDAVPGTPAWDLHQDLASRAMRLIRDGLIDREGVAGLAGHLGYTSRHLHRVMVTELGASPLALARAHRAHTARTLLTQTDLSLADIAFAAGFGSVRQFNDTIATVFQLTPSAIRQTHPPHHSMDHHGAATLLHLTVPYREPYDARGMITFLAARAIDGVERCDVNALSYTRSLDLPHGYGAFRATVTPGALAIELEIHSLADVPMAIARIRHLFDLDADPGAVDTILAADPALAPSVSRTPGIRLPGSVNDHEIVVRALVGQQISVAAARTHLSRMALALGTPITSRLGVTQVFPNATQLADGAAEVFRGPRQRIASFLTVVRALATAELSISRAADPKELHATLMALPGVGPWTAGYITMRVVHDPDVLLSTDIALQAGARACGLITATPPYSVSSQARELTAHGHHWAPWRSYASMHLWQAVANAPSSR